MTSARLSATRNSYCTATICDAAPSAARKQGGHHCAHNEHSKRSAAIALCWSLVSLTTVKTEVAGMQLDCGCGCAT
jgi:hypothetical protein